MQKKMRKNRKGLTFVETIMAVSILSIIILASTAVSATYLRGRISIKKYQSNNEELSVALNYLAKDIRMSSLVTPAYGSPCQVYNPIIIQNNVDGSEVTYRFVGSELQRNDETIIKNVSGSFFVKASNPIPRITIRLEKAGVPGMVAQTTVSMRTRYKDD